MREKKTTGRFIRGDKRWWRIFAETLYWIACGMHWNKRDGTMSITVWQASIISLNKYYHIPGRNISQIFLEIFSDFLRNFFRISQNFFKHVLRFSVGFGTLMRKWEIFPKHSFSTVFRNCSPILFLNSQRFPHHFSDFLWFLNKTLTYLKAKN